MRSHSRNFSAQCYVYLYIFDQGFYMKRLILGITLGFVSCAILALITLFLFSEKSNIHFTKNPNGSSQSLTEKNHNIRKIAILLPISHPALEEIKDGFLQTLSEVVEVQCDIFNGNGDRLLMLSQAEEALSKKYDLICAIAAAPFLIVQEVAKQRKNNTPLIGCAVDQELITEINTPDRTFVIIDDIYDFKKQLEALLTVTATKRIILPYYSTPGLEKQVEQLKTTCKALDINLKAVKIYSPNELYTNVDALLSNEPEIIMTLKDNVVVSAIESLINIARRKHKTLYVSDLNSVDKGAAIGFGVSEYAIGATGAQKAIDILVHHKKPNEFEHTLMSEFKFKINYPELGQQNVVIDKTLLFLLTSTLCVGK